MEEETHEDSHDLLEQYGRNRLYLPFLFLIQTRRKEFEENPISARLWKIGRARILLFIITYIILWMAAVVITGQLFPGSWLVHHAINFLFPLIWIAGVIVYVPWALRMTWEDPQYRTTPLSAQEYAQGILAPLRPAALWFVGLGLVAVFINFTISFYTSFPDKWWWYVHGLTVIVVESVLDVFYLTAIVGIYGMRVMICYFRGWSGIKKYGYAIWPFLAMCLVYLLFYRPAFYVTRQIALREQFMILLNPSQAAGGEIFSAMPLTIMASTGLLLCEFFLKIGICAIIWRETMSKARQVLFREEGQTESSPDFQNLYIELEGGETRGPLTASLIRQWVERDPNIQKCILVDAETGARLPIRHILTRKTFPGEPPDTRPGWRNLHAYTSFYTGITSILGLIVFAAPGLLMAMIAIWVGVKGLDLHQRMPLLGGKSLSIADIVLGMFFLVLGIYAALFLFYLGNR